MAKPEAAKNLISYALIGKVSGVTGCIEKDPTMVNSRSTKRGFSPLQVAASAEQNAAETMQVLLAAGADPKHQDMVRAINSRTRPPPLPVSLLPGHRLT
jgi:hypothetical protein